MPLSLEEAEALIAELRRRLVWRQDGRRLRVAYRTVGSVRRREGRAADVDLVATPRGGALLTAPPVPELRPPRAGDRVAGASIELQGRRRSRLALRLELPGGRRAGVGADIFWAEPAELPYALFHWTGPRAYNIRTRAHAKRRGWRLNQYGLWLGESARRVPGSERALARFLGVSHRPPAARR